MTSLRCTLFAAVMIAAVGSAHAKPPPGTDPTTPTAQWFKAQHSMDGSWCCDIADGHLLDDEDWRMKNSTYEVRINGEWVAIPERQSVIPMAAPTLPVTQSFGTPRRAHQPGNRTSFVLLQARSSNRKLGHQTICPKLTGARYPDWGKTGKRNWRRSNATRSHPMQPTTIGLDLARHVFQVHAVAADGKVLVQRKLRRSKVREFFAKQPPCLVGIEACASAHHRAGELSLLGHTVRLMPATHPVNEGPLTAGCKQSTCRSHVFRDSSDGRGHSIHYHVEPIPVGRALLGRSIVGTLCPAPWA